MKYYKLICIFLFYFFLGNGYAEQLNLDKSVVQIIVTYQKFDSYFPWQKKRPGVRYGYGVIIGNKNILVTEALIRNHIMIEYRRTKSGMKFPVTVEQADHQTNVALLNMNINTELNDMVPLELSESVKQNDSLTVVQFDEDGILQYGDGQLIKISVENLSKSPNHILAFSVLTDLNINGEGAIVVHEGKLVGIFMRYSKSNRIGIVLPYPVLKKFINDVYSPPYKGFSSAGFEWTPLVDPVKRNYLNVPQKEGGVIILSTSPGYGAAEVLKKDDVLIEWDGNRIDSLGYYEDNKFGRLMMPYLVRKHYPGDIVSVTVIRKGKKIKKNILLKQYSEWNSLVPDNTEGLRDEYLVEGGFIIRELTGQYLFEFGRDWRLHNNARIVYIYNKKNYQIKSVGERIVIISKVLPDPVNVGYQNLRDAVISEINNKPVKSIKDVFDILKEEGTLERIKLKSVKLDIVIDNDRLYEANERISRLYQIPSRSYQRDN